MRKIKSALQAVPAARWFPTVTSPILIGAAGSGIVYGLHVAFGINVLPQDAENAAAPLVGFLLAAIAQKRDASKAISTVNVKATVATHTTTYSPEATLGQTIAASFVKSMGDVIDSDPSLLNSVGAQALERVLHPAQVVDPAPQTVPQQLPQT